MLSSVGLMLNRVALGLWVGLVAALFVAGLTVLNAMPGGRVYVALSDDSLRTSAGEIVGALFRTYYMVAPLLGTVAIAGAMLSRRSGLWKPALFTVHVIGLFIMLNAMFLDAGWIYGKVHALAEQIPEHGLAKDSSLYAPFWKWHGISMLLNCVVLVVGVITLAVGCFPRDAARPAARTDTPVEA